ncbi:hypothetical protein V8B97DRAFT_1932767 [Scleroderma yunnanense]
MPDNMGDTGTYTESEPRTSTPSPSSSPETNDCVEQTLPRKREREVSLEPATPKTSLVANASDIKSPAKKGRVNLDTTLEEEDAQQRSRSRTPSHPHSPALSVSPPHEVKVRQISQGVEDINWQRHRSLSHNDAEHPGCNLEASDDKEDEQAAPQEGPSQNAEEPPCSLPTTQEVVVEVDEAADIPSSLPPTRRTSESEGGEPEKGLKRKLADRGTSQGPESPSITTASAETTKRLRDDGDKDDNPRISKRPSPPPEQRENAPTSTETTTSKLGGFMAYAALASPFASVKGQSVFSSASGNSQHKKPPTSPTLPPPSPLPTPISGIPSNSTSILSPFSQPVFTTLSQQSSLQQTPQSTATKRSGFEAFAGASSPFASPFAYTRSKSPLGSNSKSVLARSRSPSRRANMNTNPFSTYTGGSQSFAIPVPKRARAESPSGGSSRSSMEGKQSPGFGLLRSNESSASGEEEEGEREENGPESSTFGEKLRSAKDIDDDRSEEEKERLTEQEVLTGEEEEETIHQVRGKLYVLCPQNQWKERGTGQLRLNVRRFDGGGARLLMRKEAVFTVILNVTLFPGIKCFIAQDPRYIRFSAIEGGATAHYNLRVANAKIAQELLEEINANIPC